MYETRLQELSSELVVLRRRHQIHAALLVVASAAFLLLGLHWRAALTKPQSLIPKPQSPIWWPLLPLPVAAVAATRYRRTRLASSRLWRLKRFYQRGLQRTQGLWAGEGFSGEEFLNPDHPYARDLSVLGPGSLFERLCVARTAIGRRALAKYLLDPPSIDQIRSRQHAIAELRSRTDLREAIAALGEFEAAESHWNTFADWLSAPPVAFSRAARVFAAVTSTIVLGIVLAGIFGALSWTNAAVSAAPFVLCHSIFGLVYRQRVRAMSESLLSAALETRVLREGLQILEQQRFESPLLTHLADSVRGAGRSVRHLEHLLYALHGRNKDWFYQLSLLLMAGTQLCMAIETWRRRHGPALATWIDSWGEFEALNALANYAYENPDYVFPEILPGDVRFEAGAMRHPLLPDATCVPNDVRLDPTTRFYVVSGSNMSGKSSLLRAIGLHAVLAFAGAPVPAAALRLSPLSVCASISVVDSLLNGKSKFLAEVDRVRLAIESATSSTNVLFLIDEIFSGTNSRDRRVAAEAVVRTLLARGAIGALSTHDLSLTEIADAPELHGANVHLGSGDAGNPMSFDYRLKPGITRETNALAIARLASVPVLSSPTPES